MRRIRLFLPVFFLLAFASAPANAYQDGVPQDLAREALRIETKSASHSFMVQMAVTWEQQRIGLMFVKSMPEREGMLFTFRYPTPAEFWMRNTYIPLDLIFIRPDGTIANIAHNAVPLSLEAIESEDAVTGVLEINGGLAKKLGIEPGDKVIHPWFDGEDGS